MRWRHAGVARRRFPPRAEAQTHPTPAHGRICAVPEVVFEGRSGRGRRRRACSRADPTPGLDSAFLSRALGDAGSETGDQLGTYRGQIKAPCASAIRLRHQDVSCHWNKARWAGCRGRHRDRSRRIYLIAPPASAGAEYLIAGATRARRSSSSVAVRSISRARPSEIVIEGVLRPKRSSRKGRRESTGYMAHRAPDVQRT
jgi:hypothetical protein